jgi:hypothetical protein
MKNTRHFTGDHAIHVQLCGWLEPQLPLLPDILLVGEAELKHDGINNTRNSLGCSRIPTK